MRQNPNGRGKKKRLTERQIKENRGRDLTKLREKANETVDSPTNKDKKNGG